MRERPLRGSLFSTIDDRYWAGSLEVGATPWSPAAVPARSLRNVEQRPRILVGHE